MNKKEFFEYVKTLKDFQSIIDTYHPDIIYLGGSRAIGYESIDSDYDLIAHTNTEFLQTSYKNIRINNEKDLDIHCMISTVEGFLGMLLDDYRYGSPIHSLASFSTGIDKVGDNIIYLKNGIVPDYVQVFSDFKKPCVELCCYNMLAKIHWDLQIIVEHPEITLNTKLYYHLLLYYDLIFNDNSQSLIKNIKTKNNLTASQRTEVLAKLSKLLNFYNSFDESKYNSIKSILEVVRYGSENSRKSNR